MLTWLKQNLPGRRANRRGVLTLEWILLVSVLVIGIIAGLGAVRDALVCELDDLADAIAAINGDDDVDEDSPPPLVQ